ncbi:MAG: hypothetical protein K0M45_05610 [Candidatus Paracaedibacteraceae bacterium]|nr:hypothetical protein [Candidatus Paracaedibacteraceae bacterium]
MRAVANGGTVSTSTSSLSTAPRMSSGSSGGPSSRSGGASSSSSSSSTGQGSSSSARQGSTGGASRPDTSLGRNLLTGEVEPKGKGVIRDSRHVVEVAPQPKTNFSIMTSSSLDVSKQSAKNVVAAESSRGRAPEFPGGTVTESKFLNHAEQCLGSGYLSLPNGRSISQDGLRQLRYGRHEVTSASHHGHFEAYNRPGGNIIENTVVEILPD